MQTELIWAPSFEVAGALLDQLARSGDISSKKLTAIRALFDSARQIADREPTAASALLQELPLYSAREACRATSGMHCTTWLPCGRSAESSGGARSCDVTRPPHLEASDERILHLESGDVAASGDGMLRSRSDVRRCVTTGAV
jgi:hypothetical protein